VVLLTICAVIATSEIDAAALFYGTPDKT